MKDLLYVTLTDREKICNGGPELTRLLAFGEKFDSITVYCQGSGKSRIKNIEFEGMSLHKLLSKTLVTAKNYSSLMGASLHLDGFIVTRAGQLFFTPSCIRCGGLYKYSSKFKNWLSEKMQNWTIKNCTKIVVNSEYLSTMVDGSVVVRNGVDLEKFPLNKKKDFKKTLLYLGRVREDKGAKFLEDLSNQTDWEITMIGKKSYNVKTHNKLHHFDEIEHKYVSKEFKSYDALILPTTSISSDSLPNVLLEAMASGLPCIASDVAGISEILHAEALFPENDMVKAKKILKKLENKRFRNKLINHGKKVAKEHELDKMNKELTEALFT